MYIYIYIYIYRSEGFALTGYDIPGCVEDGAWMLWGNSSVDVAVVAVVAVVAAAVVAHPGLGGGGAPRLWLFPKSNHKNAPGGAFFVI